MKSFIASLVPILFSVLVGWLAIIDSWWFVLAYLLIGQYAWHFILTPQHGLDTPMVLRTSWSSAQLFFALVCTVVLTVFAFIVFTPWWAVLILLVINLIAPFVLPIIYEISVLIFTFIPMLLFGTDE